MKYNVFKKLAIFMIGFGIIMGVTFPFFVVLATTASPEVVYTPLFFTMCITAGIMVGAVNIILAKRIVGVKVRQLSTHMKYVENRLQKSAKMRSLDECTDENCYIKTISNDEIGQSAEAFNSLVKALSEAFKSEASVREFTELLSSRLELERLAIEALSKLLEGFNAYGGAIIIEKDGDLELLTSYAITRPNELIKNKTIMQIFKNQTRQILRLPDEVFLDGLLLEFKPKSILFEPIIYKGVVLGVVILASINEFQAETQEDMKLYGQGLALAFKNAITHDQLQRLAANDPLTGALNRRFGIERLKDEYVRAVKTNQPLGILMIDIDRFKSVNDTYGHLVGDKVILGLTQVSKASLREGDIFFRYGGEEFVAILPGASIKDVRKIAERLRRSMEELEVSYGDQLIKVTISIGGTSLPERNIDNYNELIEIADTNMYQAKESGRNHTIVN